MPAYANQDIINYVSRIKLTQERKSSYTSQVDSLKSKVEEAVKNMDNTKIIKVKRAGSWKKGTALAPKGENPLDVDMVFFMEVDEDIGFDAEDLRTGIIDALCSAYPNKERSDFTSGKTTVGVVFKGSGLEVDIVPFIPEKGNTTYGKQPRKKINNGEFKTSVDKQLDFIIKVKERSPIFTSLVCMLKAWRNYSELELSSFSIELIVAHLIIIGKIADASINDAIIRCFEFLGNDEVVNISFPGAIGEKSHQAPWIADPTNNENDTLRLSHDEWDNVRKAGETGFETISYAGQVRETGKTMDLWKEVFGPSFNVEEA